MALVRRFAVILVALALAALIGAAQEKPPAPEFSLKTAAGKTVNLANLRGKLVAVNFWATWCGPCRAEIPGMNEVYQKYRGKGFEIVGISVDRDGWSAINPFVRRMNIDYPVVLGDGGVTDAYGGIDAIPTTFFVDRQGRVIMRHVGYMSKDDFEKIVKSAL